MHGGVAPAALEPWGSLELQRLLFPSSSPCPEEHGLLLWPGWAHLLVWTLRTGPPASACSAVLRLASVIF